MGEDHGAILKIITLAFADFEAIIWNHCHLAAVKQCVDVGVQDQTVDDSVVCIFSETLDV